MINELFEPVYFIVTKQTKEVKEVFIHFAFYLNCSVWQKKKKLKEFPHKIINRVKIHNYFVNFYSFGN